MCRFIFYFFETVIYANLDKMQLLINNVTKHKRKMRLLLLVYALSNYVAVFFVMLTWPRLKLVLRCCWFLLKYM